MGERIRRAFKDLLKNKKRLKTAALIVMVIAALLLFGHNGKNDEIRITDGSGSEAAGDMSDDDTGDSTGGKGDEEDAGSEDKSDPSDDHSGKPSIYVDISGEVSKPGVYKAAEGMRIFNIVELAGGFTEKADLSSINQAELIFDGEKIIIPAKNQADGNTGSNAGSLSGSAASGYPSAGNSSGQSGNVVNAGSGAMKNNGLININTADADALQEIPGVGPVTAGKIIDYRTRNGRFRTKEDIKNVSGIGDKTYAKMESRICV